MVSLKVIVLCVIIAFAHATSGPTRISIIRTGGGVTNVRQTSFVRQNNDLPVVNTIEKSAIIGADGKIISQKTVKRSGLVESGTQLIPPLAANIFGQSGSFGQAGISGLGAQLIPLHAVVAQQAGFSRPEVQQIPPSAAVIGRAGIVGPDVQQIPPSTASIGHVDIAGLGVQQIPPSAAGIGRAGNAGPQVQQIPPLAAGIEQAGTAGPGVQLISPSAARDANIDELGSQLIFLSNIAILQRIGLIEPSDKIISPLERPGIIVPSLDAQLISPISSASIGRGGILESGVQLISPSASVTVGRSGNIRPTPCAQQIPPPVSVNSKPGVQLISPSAARTNIAGPGVQLILSSAGLTGIAEIDAQLIAPFADANIRHGIARPQITPSSPTNTGIANIAGLKDIGSAELGVQSIQSSDMRLLKQIPVSSQTT